MFYAIYTDGTIAVAQYDYNPNEDYAETELKLREHLQSFLETVKSFNMIYTKVNILCNGFFFLPNFPYFCCTFR